MFDFLVSLIIIVIFLYVSYRFLKLLFFRSNINNFGTKGLEYLYISVFYFLQIFYFFALFIIKITKILFFVLNNSFFLNLYKFFYYFISWFIKFVFSFFSYFFWYVKTYWIKKPRRFLIFFLFIYVLKLLPKNRDLNLEDSFFFKGYKLNSVPNSYLYRKFLFENKAVSIISSEGFFWKSKIWNVNDENDSYSLNSYNLTTKNKIMYFRFLIDFLNSKSTINLKKNDFSHYLHYPKMIEYYLGTEYQRVLLYKSWNLSYANRVLFRTIPRSNRLFITKFYKYSEKDYTAFNYLPRTGLNYFYDFSKFYSNIRYNIPQQEMDLFAYKRWFWSKKDFGNSTLNNTMYNLQDFIFNRTSYNGYSLFHEIRSVKIAESTLSNLNLFFLYNKSPKYFLEKVFPNAKTNLFNAFRQNKSLLNDSKTATLYETMYKAKRSGLYKDTFIFNYKTELNDKPFSFLTPFLYSFYTQYLNYCEVKANDNRYFRRFIEKNNDPLAIKNKNKYVPSLLKSPNTFRSGNRKNFFKPIKHHFPQPVYDGFYIMPRSSIKIKPDVLALLLKQKRTFPDNANDISYNFFYQPRPIYLQPSYYDRNYTKPLSLSLKENDIEYHALRFPKAVVTPKNKFLRANLNKRWKHKLSKDLESFSSADYQVRRSIRKSTVKKFKNRNYWRINPRRADYAYADNAEEVERRYILDDSDPFTLDAEPNFHLTNVEFYFDTIRYCDMNIVDFLKKVNKNKTNSMLLNVFNTDNLYFADSKTKSLSNFYQQVYYNKLFFNYAKTNSNNDRNLYTMSKRKVLMYPSGKLRAPTKYDYYFVNKIGSRGFIEYKRASTFLNNNRFVNGLKFHESSFINYIWNELPSNFLLVEFKYLLVDFFYNSRFINEFFYNGQNISFFFTFLRAFFTISDKVLYNFLSSIKIYCITWYAVLIDDIISVYVKYKLLFLQYDTLFVSSRSMIRRRFKTFSFRHALSVPRKTRLRPRKVLKEFKGELLAYLGKGELKRHRVMQKKSGKGDAFSHFFKKKKKSSMFYQKHNATRHSVFRYMRLKKDRPSWKLKRRQYIIVAKRKIGYKPAGFLRFKKFYFKYNIRSVMLKFANSCSNFAFKNLSSSLNTQYYKFPLLKRTFVDIFKYNDLALKSKNFYRSIPLNPYHRLEGEFSSQEFDSSSSRSLTKLFFSDFFKSNKPAYNMYQKYSLSNTYGFAPLLSRYSFSFAYLNLIEFHSFNNQIYNNSFTFYANDYVDLKYDLENFFLFNIPVNYKLRFLKFVDLKYSDFFRWKNYYITGHTAWSGDNARIYETDSFKRSTKRRFKRTIKHRSTVFSENKKRRYSVLTNPLLTDNFLIKHKFNQINRKLHNIEFSDNYLRIYFSKNHKRKKKYYFKVYHNRYKDFFRSFKRLHVNRRRPLFHSLYNKKVYALFDLGLFKYFTFFRLLPDTRGGNSFSGRLLRLSRLFTLKKTSFDLSYRRKSANIFFNRRFKKLKILRYGYYNTSFRRLKLKKRIFSFENMKKKIFFKRRKKGEKIFALNFNSKFFFKNMKFFVRLFKRYSFLDNFYFHIPLKKKLLFSVSNLRSFFFRIKTYGFSRFKALPLLKKNKNKFVLNIYNSNSLFGYSSLNNLKFTFKNQRFSPMLFSEINFFFFNKAFFRSYYILRNQGVNFKNFVNNKSKFHSSSSFKTFYFSKFFDVFLAKFVGFNSYKFSKQLHFKKQTSELKFFNLIFSKRKNIYLTELDFNNKRFFHFFSRLFSMKKDIDFQKFFSTFKYRTKRSKSNKKFNFFKQRSYFTNHSNKNVFPGIPDLENKKLNEKNFNLINGDVGPKGSDQVWISKLALRNYKKNNVKKRFWFSRVTDGRSKFSRKRVFSHKIFILNFLKSKKYFGYDYLYKSRAAHVRGQKNYYRDRSLPLVVFNQNYKTSNFFSLIKTHITGARSRIHRRYSVKRHDRKKLAFRFLLSVFETDKKRRTKVRKFSRRFSFDMQNLKHKKKTLRSYVHIKSTKIKKRKRLYKKYLNSFSVKHRKIARRFRYKYRRTGLNRANFYRFKSHHPKRRDAIKTVNNTRFVTQLAELKNKSKRKPKKIRQRFMLKDLYYFKPISHLKSLPFLHFLTTSNRLTLQKRNLHNFILLRKNKPFFKMSVKFLYGRKLTSFLYESSENLTHLDFGLERKDSFTVRYPVGMSQRKKGETKNGYFFKRRYTAGRRRTRRLTKTCALNAYIFVFIHISRGFLFYIRSFFEFLFFYSIFFLFIVLSFLFLRIYAFFWVKKVLPQLIALRNIYFVSNLLYNIKFNTDITSFYDLKISKFNHLNVLKKQSVFIHSKYSKSFNVVELQRKFHDRFFVRNFIFSYTWDYKLSYLKIWLKGVFSTLLDTLLYGFFFLFFFLFNYFVNFVFKFLYVFLYSIYVFVLKMLLYHLEIFIKRVSFSDFSFFLVIFSYLLYKLYSIFLLIIRIFSFLVFFFVYLFAIYTFLCYFSLSLTDLPSILLVITLNLFTIFFLAYISKTISNLFIESSTNNLFPENIFELYDEDSETQSQGDSVIELDVVDNYPENFYKDYDLFYYLDAAYNHTDNIENTIIPSFFETDLSHKLRTQDQEEEARSILVYLADKLMEMIRMTDYEDEVDSTAKKVKIKQDKFTKYAPSNFFFLSLDHIRLFNYSREKSLYENFVYMYSGKFRFLFDYRHYYKKRRKKLRHWKTKQRKKRIYLRKRVNKYFNFNFFTSKNQNVLAKSRKPVKKYQRLVYALQYKEFIRLQKLHIDVIKDIYYPFNYQDGIIWDNFFDNFDFSNKVNWPSLDFASTFNSELNSFKYSDSVNNLQPNDPMANIMKKKEFTKKLKAVTPRIKRRIKRYMNMWFLDYDKFEYENDMLRFEDGLMDLDEDINDALEEEYDDEEEGRMEIFAEDTEAAVYFDDHVLSDEYTTSLDYASLGGFYRFVNKVRKKARLNRIARKKLRRRKPRRRYYLRRRRRRKYRFNLLRYQRFKNKYKLKGKYLLDNTAVSASSKGLALRSSFLYRGYFFDSRIEPRRLNFIFRDSNDIEFQDKNWLKDLLLKRSFVDTSLVSESEYVFTAYPVTLQDINSVLFLDFKNDENGLGRLSDYGASAFWDDHVWITSNSDFRHSISKLFLQTNKKYRIQYTPSVISKKMRSPKKKKRSWYAYIRFKPNAKTHQINLNYNHFKKRASFLDFPKDFEALHSQIDFVPITQYMMLNDIPLQNLNLWFKEIFWFQIYDNRFKRAFFDNFVFLVNLLDLRHFPVLTLEESERLWGYLGCTEKEWDTIETDPVIMTVPFDMREIFFFFSLFYFINCIPFSNRKGHRRSLGTINDSSKILLYKQDLTIFGCFDFLKQNLGFIYYWLHWEKDSLGFLNLYRYPLERLSGVYPSKPYIPYNVFFNPFFKLWVNPEQLFVNTDYGLYYKIIMRSRAFLDYTSTFSVNNGLMNYPQKRTWVIGRQFPYQSTLNWIKNGNNYYYGFSDLLPFYNFGSIRSFGMSRKIFNIPFSNSKEIGWNDLGFSMSYFRITNGLNGLFNNNMFFNLFNPVASRKLNFTINSNKQSFSYARRFVVNFYDRLKLPRTSNFFNFRSINIDYDKQRVFKKPAMPYNKRVSLPANNYINYKTLKNNTIASYYPEPLLTQPSNALMNLRSRTMYTYQWYYLRFFVTLISSVYYLFFVFFYSIFFFFYGLFKILFHYILWFMSFVVSDFVIIESYFFFMEFIKIFMYKFVYVFQILFLTFLDLLCYNSYYIIDFANVLFFSVYSQFSSLDFWLSVLYFPIIFILFFFKSVFIYFYSLVDISELWFIWSYFSFDLESYKESFLYSSYYYISSVLVKLYEFFPFLYIDVFLPFLVLLHTLINISEVFFITYNLYFHNIFAFNLIADFVNYYHFFSKYMFFFNFHFFLSFDFFFTFENYFFALIFKLTYFPIFDIFISLIISFSLILILYFLFVLFSVYYFFFYVVLFFIGILLFFLTFFFLIAYFILIFLTLIYNLFFFL